MSESEVRWTKLLWTGLVIGFVFNLLGWIGNVIVLGDL